MAHRIFFDIYGRVRVTAEHTTDGAWVMYQLGTDGKRSRPTDVIIPDR